MEKEIVENVDKIPFFKPKVDRIYKFIEEENYTESYKCTANLIEIVCTTLLEKVHNKRLENPNMFTLISNLEENKEGKLADILIEINGEYNSKNLNKVTKLDLRFLLVYLDEIVRSIVEKHGDIFKENNNQ